MIFLGGGGGEVVDNEVLVYKSNKIENLIIYQIDLRFMYVKQHDKKHSFKIKKILLRSKLLSTYPFQKLFEVLSSS